MSLCRSVERSDEEPYPRTWSRADEEEVGLQEFYRLLRIGNLEVCDEASQEPFSTQTGERSLVSQEKSYSEESVQGAAKLSDFASDLVQLSKLSTAAPRLDAEAKQARIIEAIYQASGREVPEMYKSKTQSREAIPVPRKS
ncbi:hypothetical protein TELCIR_11802 [Teladorsagia circumcincta]|uniref:Uncharacterized protein n=1 Tax=Teladorsagia circumcincta TaxID=45464 RepID=A0A2G9U8I3_TELCI|nr:hypothetical protein TELCIR_11802 [Teladorsagia circumcincta]